MNSQQLKSSILHLAVQGKLVPQNPSDEPASVLLARISQERERLIKEQKIKKPKSTSRIFRRDGHFYESINGGGPTCIDEEIPFDIPESWEWCRLSTLSYVVSGTSYNKTDVDSNGIRILRGDNIQGEEMRLHPEDVYVPFQYKDENKNIATGDIILVGSTGSKLVIGKAAYVFNPLENTQIGAFLRIVRPYSKKYAEYVAVIFKTTFYRDYIRKKASGTSINNIKSRHLENFLIPVPPIQEQQRIVDKIHELQPLLSDYGIAVSHLSNLDSVFPASLKKSLLQWAIQGKLVPQNPNDEPASVLLKRIAEERTAKLGKKAAKSMSRIERRGSKIYEIFPDGTEKDISGEIPFDIPTSWVWARLKNIFETFSTGPFGTMVHKDDYTDASDGIPLINPTNIKDGSVCTTRLQRVKQEKAIKLENYKLSTGDIIVARRGNLSKCAIISQHEEEWLCGTGAFFLHLSYISNEYFCIFYSSPYTQNMLVGASVGSTIVNLNQKLLNNLLFPIPPLNEQHRIVEKLGALLKLV